MRIRTVKPEFWRSDDIAALDREDRLLFIGLWSYVDDNGVGRDSAALIAGDIFPHDMEQDPRDTLARIHRGLATLAASGLITRYSAHEEGKEHQPPRTWVSVVNWHHQKIDRPNKARYPGPDQAIAESHRDTREDSSSTRDNVASVVSTRGELDQRRTGSEENSLAQPQSRPSARVTTEMFDQFWQAYPRKVGKQEARRFFDTAVKRVGPDVVIQGAIRYADDPNLAEVRFIPHPSTWLNRGGWDDEPLPSRGGGQTEQQKQDLKQRMAELDRLEQEKK